MSDVVQVALLQYLLPAIISSLIGALTYGGLTNFRLKTLEDSAKETSKLTIDNNTRLCVVENKVERLEGARELLVRTRGRAEVTE